MEKLPTLRSVPFLYILPNGVTLVFVLFSTALILLRCVLRKELKDKHGNPIPPGPLFRYPFLRKYPERPLHAWTQKYGPIYSVWMGQQLFVVLNDPKVARDLLVVHGANFSSRWAYFMKNVTILQGGGITAAPYNDTWIVAFRHLHPLHPTDFIPVSRRKHRRISMWSLTPKAIQGYADVFDYEALPFLRSLYEAGKGGSVPLNPATHAGRYALNNMLTITFGTRTLSASDPLVKEALALGKEFMHLTGPWSNAIDFIKPLQWIPTPARSNARRLREGFMKVYGAMILGVKQRVDAGEEVSDCLVKHLLDRQKEESLSWADMCFIANAFTTGGVHSTSGIIQWLLAFMPSHPHIQAKAHEELDRVVGRDHWPTASDEARLPYIRAIIKEAQVVIYVVNACTGSTCSFAILDGNTSLLRARFCIQWILHPEEHCHHPQLLFSASQRRSLFRLLYFQSRSILR
ncbi:hypothetical protein HGRIS_005679 [Hohenbuehelia grisea]|uniref:Cytochrome P450 n=1 Tax=Hohenbuehelia grisea TaxID=104357 RepID=A0ABR3JXJ6_9AGAR